MRSSPKTRQTARRLRRELSPPEVLLWVRLRALRDEGPTFRRQHPIGPYVADFYCPLARLVIEIDGPHHTEDERAARDEVRDAYMRRLGYRVMRIPGGDVMREPDETAQGVVQAALALIGEQ